MRRSNLSKLLLLSAWMAFGTKCGVNNTFGNSMSHRWVRSWPLLDGIWYQRLQGMAHFLESAQFQDKGKISWLFFKFFVECRRFFLNCLWCWGFGAQKGPRKREILRFIQRLREDQGVSVPGDSPGVTITVTPKVRRPDSIWDQDIFS